MISGVTAKFEESLAPRRQCEKNRTRNPETPRTMKLSTNRKAGVPGLEPRTKVSREINENGDFASCNARYRTLYTRAFRQLQKSRTIGSRVCMTVSDWSAWREVAVTGSDRKLIHSMWS